jgi:DNA-binding HxlR family transcriptional regulator
VWTSSDEPAALTEHASLPAHSKSLLYTLGRDNAPDGAREMMARKTKHEFACGVELALEVIGGKWKPVILAHLKDGPLRYGELRARIPSLSEKMLTQRLEDLRAFGLVRRSKVGMRGSPASYELTARAESLRPALQALNDWGVQVAPEFGARVARTGGV